MGLFPCVEKSGLSLQLPTTGLEEPCQTAVSLSILIKKRKRKRRKDRVKERPPRRLWEEVGEVLGR